MKPAHAPDQDARPEPRGPTHALDPVCGMQVDPANARGGSAVHDGVEYSFCSTGCREKFIAHPVKYLQASKAQVQLQRGTRSDPAVPAATAARPTPQRAGTGTLYVCPMHPQIQQDGPGSCPICGMALEPKVATAEAPDDTELRDMTRRFWISLTLSVPTLVLAMGEMIPGLRGRARR